MTTHRVVVTLLRRVGGQATVSLDVWGALGRDLETVEVDAQGDTLVLTLKPSAERAG